MNRIAEVFSTGRKALIVYLTAGYPSMGQDEDLALTAIDAGADILELGFPFSDPIADGPLIQEASQKALENGMTLSGTIGLAERVRERRDAPIVLMGYVNPVHHMGYGNFSTELVKAGADGAIIPDLPLEMAGPLKREMKTRGLALIPMAAPNTPIGRLERIAENGDGFLYLVSMAGLTGDSMEGKAPWKAVASEARSLGNLPICLGFGIRTGQDAYEACMAVDGVIVGSAVTQVIRDSAGPEEAKEGVRRLVGELKEAIS